MKAITLTLTLSLKELGMSHKFFAGHGEEMGPKAI